MTMHTTGWVEVRDPYHFFPHSMGPNPHPCWEAVLLLQPLVSKHFIQFGGAVEWGAVNAALSEGLPADASDLAAESYASDETAYDGIVSPPGWATWATLRPLGWNAPPGSDWQLLAHILDLLAQRYGADNVRIILWTLTNM
jgi:hypothetical protein